MEYFLHMNMCTIFGNALGPLQIVEVIIVLFGPWAFILGICLVKTGQVAAWRKLCPHGIANGATEGRCKDCVASEERYRLWQIEHQKQAALDLLVNKVKNEEAKRLADLFVPSLEELFDLTPQSFEDAIADMFRRLGYQVTQTPYSNDHGRDAILTKGNKKFLVECKRYGSGQKSGRPDLQKFHSAIISEKASMGFFVTTGTVTNQGIEFAKKSRIEIVDASRLIQCFIDSKILPSSNDSYHSLCSSCGSSVTHHLRFPQNLTCKNGHIVKPTLKIIDMFNQAVKDVPQHHEQHLQ